MRMADKVLSYLRFRMATVSHRYPHRNLHGQIVHTLGRRILRGDLQPGDALQAGKAMAASRTALREAIKVLAAKGLVEAKPKIGTRVTPRESWNLLDPDVMAWEHADAPRPAFLRKLTEVRAVIEPQAAALAATRAVRADITVLETAFEQMAAAVEQPGGSDFDAFDEADLRFHLAIVRASGNDLLEQMTRVVYSALAVSFRTTSRLPGSARRSLPKHRAILRAIAAGAPARAKTAMERLVSGTAREISQLPEGDTHEAVGGQERDRHRRSPGDRPRDRGAARGGGRAGHVLRSRQRRG
jgi:DNA-binding FadR family transcriptional regulator